MSDTQQIKVTEVDAAHAHDEDSTYICHTTPLPELQCETKANRITFGADTNKYLTLFLVMKFYSLTPTP